MNRALPHLHAGTRISLLLLLLSVGLSCACAKEDGFLSSVNNAKKALQRLPSTCIDKQKDYWSYSVCMNDRVRQYHAVAGPPKEEVTYANSQKDFDWSLGEYKREKIGKVKRRGEVIPGFIQTFEGGQNCDENGKQRATDVVFVCNAEVDFADIVSIKEPRLCEYMIMIETAYLCDGVQVKTKPAQPQQSVKEKSDTSIPAPPPRRQKADNQQIPPRVKKDSTATSASASPSPPSSPPPSPSPSPSTSSSTSSTAVRSPPPSPAPSPSHTDIPSIQTIEDVGDTNPAVMMQLLNELLSEMKEAEDESEGGMITKNRFSSPSFAAVLPSGSVFDAALPSLSDTALTEMELELKEEVERIKQATTKYSRAFPSYSGSCFTLPWRIKNFGYEPVMVGCHNKDMTGRDTQPWCPVASSLHSTPPEQGITPFTMGEHAIIGCDCDGEEKELCAHF
mmetsp:Transcript_3385/g.6643  ORF Transcript_3385/g.6643 Transcript_3385/m.6643 type:complete len:450 (-) Transcript_3385:321-1670(-)